MGKIAKSRIDTLASQLQASAFRRGTSAFRFGLVPRGCSDHLPIQLTSTTHGFKAMSWNLLADVHLFNNFMNISGSDVITRLLQKQFPAGNPYIGNIYHFFSELAQYLFDKVDGADTLEIDPALLKQFISLDNRPSRLARSRDPAKAAQKASSIKQARAYLMDLFIDKNSEHAGEFNVAIRHALEMIFHIKKGALLWENRYQLITENPELGAAMVAQDFLCLQECTNPADIETLFVKAAKPYRLLTHRIHEHTNDHCALFYNPGKYKLIDAVSGALDGKKPFIVAKFLDNSTGKYIIIGSIHHPGGHHNKLPELLEAVTILSEMPPKASDYYLLGDFNNTREFYEAEQKEITDNEYTMLFPTRGTLCGSDFENNNQAIDAVLTNIDAKQAQVHVLDTLVPVKPAETPLKLSFKYVQDLQSSAPARFFKPVQREVKQDESRLAAKAMGVSDAVMGPRMKLGAA